jgi:hypothetical protein
MPFVGLAVPRERFVAVLVATVLFAACSQGMVSDMSPEEWTNPGRGFGGLEEHRNARLAPKSDRWDITDTPVPHGEAATVCERGTAYLVSDLCAMGHLTKDAAMLSSWLDDHTASGLSAHDEEIEKSPVASDRRGDPSAMPPLTAVVFSNKCMTKELETGAKADKRVPLFYNVLQHWFIAILTEATRNDTLKAAKRGSLDVTLESLSHLVERRPAELFLHRPGSPKGPVRVLFGEDLQAIQSTRGTVCFEAVVKRGAERWRWFRTHKHAEQFRSRMWHYFDIAKLSGVTLAEPFFAATSEERCRRRVTVLVRDEDRHFDEVRVAKMLEESLGNADVTVGSYPGAATCRVDVRLEKFDRIKGSTKAPPPHHEQLRILGAQTDVLVAAHGAGLAAVAVMRPGTTVIELFPHNFRYFMYEELAQLAGVRYIPYESPVVHPPRCCSARGGDVTPRLVKPHDGNGIGARACKKCDILIPDDDLLALVEDALASSL